MIKKIILLALLMVWSGPADAIRCSNDIIATGDTQPEVQLKLEKCGEVIDKSIIKKEITSNRSIKNRDEVNVEKEERLIERWYIRVNETGGKYCYPLDFSQGVLLEIGTWTKCEQ